MSSKKMHARIFLRELGSVDCAVFDSLLGVTGSSLLVDAEIEGTLGRDGMVSDFGRAKKTIREVLDRLCDHRLVAPAGSVERVGSRRCRFRASYENGEVEYLCPESALCVIGGEYDASLSGVARLAEKLVMKRMPRGVSSLRLEFREEKPAKGAAYYRYCHGLKDYPGACSRLFHGHRSRLEVLVEGRPRPDLASRLAAGCDLAHFARASDLGGGKIIPGMRQEHLSRVELGYEAGRGRFFAALPGRDVYALSCEPTVENIALHLAGKVRSMLKVEGVRVLSGHVRAFEGIRKGAIAPIPAADRQNAAGHSGIGC